MYNYIPVACEKEENQGTSRMRKSGRMCKSFETVFTALFLT
jgi:hypothetical protein